MTVTAKIQPQEWINNVLQETSNHYVFDCEKALDAIPFYRLPFTVDEIDLGALRYGEDIVREAEKMGLVAEWPGPLQFYIVDKNEYDEYYARRIILEE